ncbi:hypothetical protein CcCBS67573_g10158 [Chytriomyces confervae]|uniref:Uncharacterized protein n=1 Tax=Chytriomyces confervae TaxID=246404 RepID=A0A507DFB8_9FUNG
MLQVSFGQTFCPFAAEWDLDEHQLRAALAYAEVGGVDTCQSVSNLLLLLHAKDILSAENPGTRKLMFHDLLHGTSDTLVARLNRLKASSLDPKSFFESFIESHPEWSARINVFVAQRDHPSPPRKRARPCRCCMHVPVLVLQHCLVAMNNADPIPMINIAEFLENECNEPS